MFEFLSLNDSTDAISLLKHDHDAVKDLFDRYERAESRGEKRQIAADIIRELKLHAAAEEKLFYPAVRPKIGKTIMNEADEEHHVAKVLIAEIESMDGSEDHYDAKVKVLAENIRHHIREEEGDMLPKARALDLDFDALGEEMQALKQKLLETGVPTFGEETMVARSRGRGDSPAEAARKQPTGRNVISLAAIQRERNAKPQTGAKKKAGVKKAAQASPKKKASARKAAAKKAPTRTASRNTSRKTASKKAAGRGALSRKKSGKKATRPSAGRSAKRTTRRSSTKRRSGAGPRKSAKSSSRRR